MIKTFRGQIGDEEIKAIQLSTRDGTMGYRIVKFECMLGGFESAEMVIKVFSVPQTSTSHNIDFSDQTLLAAALVSGSASGEIYPEDQVIIFDNVTFNQDIYLTGDKNSTAHLVNWHLELEQVKLDLNENTVATLKDIRNITQPSPLP